MDVLEPYSVLSFPTDCYRLYKGIAFDGYFFYLTMPKNCSIYKFNMDLMQESILAANKPYRCICYDNTENCFWASVDKINTRIFKLDCNMKEIDFIQISGCNRFCLNIKGLSYNCEKNSLLVAFTNFIAEIQKEGNAICLQAPHKGCCFAILSIAPYYVVSMFLNNSQCIFIYTSGGCLIKSFYFSKIYKIEDILFYPCDKKDMKIFNFYVLATKHGCYPRLLQCKIDGCDMELCCCNYEFCCPTCPSKKSMDQCTTDLIESIALEETGLSHILNALGEKLQKSNQMADNICDLLEVNKSVNKTIMNITQLEHILYAKLDTLCSLTPNLCCEDKNNMKQE